MSRIFNFLKKKDQIFRKIRENFGNVQIIQKIIQNYSVVSLEAMQKDRALRPVRRLIAKFPVRKFLGTSAKWKNAHLGSTCAPRGYPHATETAL